MATAPHINTSSSYGRLSGSMSGSSTDGGSSSAVQLPRTTNRYLSADADAALAMRSDKTTVGAVVTGLLVSGALQYTSTCLAMPFEVGKLLLQVQWVPREDVWKRVQASSGTTLPRRRKRSTSELEQDPWSDARSRSSSAWATGTDLSNDADQGGMSARGAGGHADGDDACDYEDDDAPSKYFRDPSDIASTSASRRRVDKHGYVVPETQEDAGTRPEFLMPVVVKGGVWEMIKAVVRGKEGWMGLWKGAFTTFLMDLSSTTLQSILSGIMSIFAPTALNPMPIAFSPQPVKTLTLLMTSHLMTGIFVSPLDLIRTRLVAQSTLPQHRKYKGPFDALRTIFREEGGWRTTYFHPNLLIPTILDYLFRPLFALSAPLLIENVFHLDPSAYPISYALAELVISTLSLGITLPIETVRRRLQLQYHEPLRNDRVGGLLTVPNTSTARRGLRTCVETRPVPYTGVAETVYRIVTEETAARSVAPKSDDGAMSDDEAPTVAASTHTRLSGLRGLYRGLSMGVTANLLVFVLTLLTGERQTQTTGWAEL